MQNKKSKHNVYIMYHYPGKKILQNLDAVSRNVISIHRKPKEESPPVQFSQKTLTKNNGVHS